MKKTILVLSLVFGLVGLHAQGTVNMNNRVVASGIDAPFYDLRTGLPMAGNAYFIQLYVGETSVGAAVNFRTGAGAGYMVNSDTVRTITGIPAGGAATVTLRMWESTFATYEAALNGGGYFQSSAPVSLASTGNPLSNPPGVPMDLIGLQGIIPEPSTIALAMLGGAALFLRCRK